MLALGRRTDTAATANSSRSGKSAAAETGATTGTTRVAVTVCDRVARKRSRRYGVVSTVGAATQRASWRTGLDSTVHGRLLCFCFALKRKKSKLKGVKKTENKQIDKQTND